MWKRYTIAHWDWVTLWGRYWMPAEFGILIMAKWTMFTFGFEVWKYGGMLFVGPFAIGFGTVEEGDSK